MDGYCPVCGCKTDAPDFVEYKFNGKAAVQMCGFCSKQLSTLNKSLEEDSPADEKAAGAMRWLDSVLAKEVEGRPDAVNAELARLNDLFEGERARAVQSTTDNTAQGRTAYIPMKNAQGNAQGNAPSQAELKQLTERIDALEKKFNAFKRNLFLFSILEVVIPLVLLGIVAIIFFKSDLWDSFVALTNPALGGYGGVQIF